MWFNYTKKINNTVQSNWTSIVQLKIPHIKEGATGIKRSQLKNLE